MFWTVSRAHECFWYFFMTQTSVHSFIQGTHSGVKLLFILSEVTAERRELVNHTQNSWHFNKAKRKKKTTEKNPVESADSYKSHTAGRSQMTV